MDCLLELLNNTFFGTLLAGSLLAWLGLILYRRQKAIDIKYEDLRKIRELAALLFAEIEIASRKYEGQLNIYNGKNSQLSKIYEVFNDKFEDRFKKDFDNEFNIMCSKISVATDNLIARLKIDGKYESDKF